jgi:diguanylate cyclase (GGDEF)-like protein
MNGFELCKILKQRDDSKDIPIIFLTAKTEPDDIIEGFEAGGVDYISKPFNSLELIMRVKTHLELKASRDYWKKRSMIDGLTSLYNHSYIYNHLLKELRKSVENGTTLSVIMADIDFFKKVNDTFGHQIGDKVIVKVASTINNIIEKNSIENSAVGRYGGEEYFVVLPNTTKEEAVSISNSIREKIENIDWNIDGLDKVTISLGVKECIGISVNEAIKDVDDLLYRAKQNGRNRVEY